MKILKFSNPQPKSSVSFGGHLDESSSSDGDLSPEEALERMVMSDEELEPVGTYTRIHVSWRQLVRIREECLAKFFFPPPPSHSSILVMSVLNVIQTKNNFYDYRSASG